MSIRHTYTDLSNTKIVETSLYNMLQKVALPLVTTDIYRLSAHCAVFHCPLLTSMTHLRVQLEC